MEGPDWQGQNDFVNYVVPKEYWKSLQIRDQRIAMLLQLLRAFPGLVGEADDSVPQFRASLDRLSETNGAAVGAYDQHVAKILAALSDLPQPAPDRRSGGDHQYRIARPKGGGEGRRNHLEVEKESGK